MRVFYLRLLFIINLAVAIPAGCSGEVMEPAVAGKFYPADRETLKRTVDDFLSKAVITPVEGKLIAIVTPHAGYEYSGGVAAWSYKRLKGSAFNTVIIIGPSHHADFEGVAVYAAGSMSTPLGSVRINEAAARSLLDEKAGITFNKSPYEGEHSLEVQIPFLQRTLRDFTIVPLLVGSPTRKSFIALTEGLTRLMRSDERALLVISSDLSHYHDAKTAGTMDHKVIDALERLSPRSLEQLISGGEGEMCGGFPAVYAMTVARFLGATNAMLYKYADSGDVTGDKRSVVGYASMGIYRTTFSPERKARLLALARETLQAHVTGKKLPEPAIIDPLLKADGTSFVTINDKNGQLRGCIGNIMPDIPLYRSVMDNAIAASSKDPRFPPVDSSELPGLQVEITVLSPLEPISDVKEIKIGTHGLLLEKGMNRGVFLPQVATEFGWDLPTYLAELSRKAGLPPDGWRDGKLYKFTAEIIK